MDEYKQIYVKYNDEKRLEIHNPTIFPLVGIGSQGAVFRIAADKCIKVYADDDIAKVEKNAYLRTIGSPIMPVFHDYGERYIIIEYIDGPNLGAYLLKQGRMPKSITRALVDMFYEMNNLGFLRKDESLRHILVKSKASIKVVDHYYAFSLFNPYPVKLFMQLDSIGMLKAFIKEGSNMAPKLFEEYKANIPKFFTDKN